jgi:hypothetical protein
MAKATAPVPLIAKGVEFQTIPTQMCFVEYTYSSKTKEFKAHLWLYSEMDGLRRYVWERLAESFTPAAISWTAEAMMPKPPFTQGSIFIGLKSEPQQVMAILKRLLEIDQMIIRYQVI